MNYLLYGTERFLIEKEIKDIIDKKNIDSINISKYDLEFNPLDEILEDINTISMFGTKLIIIDNSFIFLHSKGKIDNLDLLIDSISNLNEYVTVIFICNDEKIDNAKKTTKFIKSKGIIKEFNPLKNVSSNVLNMFNGYKISNKDIDLLINRVGNNLEVLYQEAIKLMLYKIDTKEITKDDIINLTVENKTVDIFKFVDDIINKNKESAIKAYKQLLIQNEEPIKIIALIASKFRLIYQACILSKKGYTEEDISKILNVHKYPAHLAIVAGYKYNRKIILKYLNDLADLDIGIKTGEKDKDLALELFILAL